MDQLPYEFDNLPVFTDLGFEFGALIGKATIRYDETGEWSVGEIYLEGSNARQATETKLEQLCEKSHHELYLNIVDHLENGRWKYAIQDEVNKALDWDGVRVPTNRSEHSTNYAALSGVLS